MPSSLLEAIRMDLDAYPLKEESELRFYTRRLLSEAYICKEGNTNTNKYAKQKGYSNINNEIRGMVFNGNVMLDYDNLLNKVTDFVMDEYLKQKNQDNEVQSFNEVMQKTLSYYKDKEKFDAQDKNQVIEFAKIILSNYFDSKHISVFSSKNGTRDYVMKKNPEQILNEMAEELKMTSSVPEAIMSVYANKVANDWISKKNNINEYDENGINSITDMIVNEINKASLNDRQKEYLINEFQNGNVDALERYIPQELINEYKKISSSLNGDDYSK